tara:strand:- start:356 stop:553 length:198 start_codon:yes stop_codon:yes gene_type:complete
MQIKSSLKTSKDNFANKEFQEEKKVDINILLNRVKIEKKDAIKKNFLITAGAIGTLAITGIITIL